MTPASLHFDDRRDAGVRLAKALARYDSEDTVIYALPRGGVSIGVEVAKQLETPLSLIVSRKIGHPENEEYAVCAVTEEGELVCEETESSQLNPQWLEEQRKEALKEIQRRRAAYESKRIPAAGKIAIIVDDGIATGLTMRAAVRSLRGELPSMIVIAAPIAPAEVADSLRNEVDDVVILDTSEPFLGVIGAYYDSFPQLSDEEVIHLMKVST